MTRSARTAFRTSVAPHLLRLGSPATTPEGLAPRSGAGLLRPTFLIIGAQKSATRWLRLNLGLHPEIYTAPTEIGFFDSHAHFAQGAAWYAEQFEGWEGEAHVGEATPSYMMWKHHPWLVARRIRRFVPEAKLIAILRNPVDRAYSGFVHHMRRGRIPHDADIIDYVRTLPPRSDGYQIIAGGWYAASLRPFVHAFGDDLLVLLHDEVQTDPVAAFWRATAHLGASGGFVPPGLDEIRFGSTAPRTSTLRKEAGLGYRDLTARQRLALYEYYRRDIARLEKMIGRDLSLWDPGRAPV
jgi:hypothetical protein